MAKMYRIIAMDRPLAVDRRKDSNSVVIDMVGNSGTHLKLGFVDRP
jgi:hypothetical protein